MNERFDLQRDLDNDAMGDDRRYQEWGPLLELVADFRMQVLRIPPSQRPKELIGLVDRLSALARKIEEEKRKARREEAQDWMRNRFNEQWALERMAEYRAELEAS